MYRLMRAGLSFSIICRVLPRINILVFLRSAGCADPVRNIAAVSSWWILSIVRSSASSLSIAGFKRGSAIPQRSAPSASALGNVKT